MSVKFVGQYDVRVEFVHFFRVRDSDKLKVEDLTRGGGHKNHCTNVH